MTTTVRDGALATTVDLVTRQFKAHGPDQLWVADITYIPTWSGFLYLAIVLDEIRPRKRVKTKHPPFRWLVPAPHRRRYLRAAFAAAH